MTVLVFILPSDFRQYNKTDLLAPFWYVITQSGSFISGLVILILIIAYLANHFKNRANKNSDLILIISIIFFTFVFSTGISEYYIKEIFQKPRPYQLYLMENGYIEQGGQTYFTMPYNERRKYLEERLNQNGNKLTEIYEPILNNWKSESGFSFPSGHAQISFFFGTIVAFILFRTQKHRYKYIFLVPLVWAVFVCLSRVITGMHFPVDVTVGSFIGMLLALTLISFPFMNKIQI